MNLWTSLPRLGNLTEPHNLEASMTRSNDIENLSATGVFVWYNLRDSRITPDDLRALLAREGFAPKTAVPDIEPSTGISRACSEWSQGRGNSRRYRCEVTRSENGTTTVGLLTRERVDRKTVEWVQVGIAEYDETTSAWTIATDAPEHDGAMLAWKDVAASRMKFLDHRWIRPNVLTFAMSAAKATNLNKGSGVYFAPRQHVDEIRKLRRVIRQIGDSTLSIATVGNDEETVADVTGAAREAILGTISEVQEQLSSWDASDRAVRSDSQANVLGEIAGLIELAETYEAALNVRLDDLRSDIAAARRKALKVIADKAA